MIETLRWRLIAVPGRLVRHAGQLILGCRPATTCSPRSSPASGPSPRCPDQPGPQGHDRKPGKSEPGATPGLQACPHPRNPGRKDQLPTRRSTQRTNRGIGSDDRG
jgi:hypothetical protein